MFVVAGIATMDRGQAPAAHMVTMDSGGEVAVIDLWNETRGTVTGQAHDGEIVRLLSQEGTDCQVETDTGERGFSGSPARTSSEEFKGDSDLGRCRSRSSLAKHT